MRFPSVLAGLALIHLISCQSPIFRMAPPGERPLRVNVWISEARPGREDSEALLSEALRDRLADRARVLPKGAEPVADEASLEVHITAIKNRGELVVENAKGAFLGPAESLAKEGATTGDPYAFAFFTALGAVVGGVAAPVAAVGTEARGLYHHARLGYKPRHFECRVTFRSRPEDGSGELFRVGAWDVVKAMKPLPEGQPHSTEAFQREEAEALARVVCDRLVADFYWSPLSRTSEPKP